MNQRPTGSKRAIFARVLGLFRPYRGRFAVLLVLIAGGAVLDLLPALLIKRIVDEATLGAQGSLASVNLTFAMLVGTIVVVSCLASLRVLSTSPSQAAVR